jgi:hypothetical protein
MIIALFSMALAQQVKVQVDPQLAAQAGVDAAEVQQLVSDTVDGTLHIEGHEEFLTRMANANALSTKGMGVDYASNPQRFVVGASFGSSENGMAPSLTWGPEQLPEGGYSVQLSLMAALNLGFLSGDGSVLRRFVLSVNGMALKGKTGVFEAEMQNLGAHLQVKMIRPPHKGIVEWGGLDLTSGYELSNYHLRLSQTMPVKAEGLRWDASGQFTLESNASTVPIELSSNMRISVVGLYTGLGWDFRLGGSRATTDLSLGGPIQVSYQGKEQRLGRVDASMVTHGLAASGSGRIFGGVQANIFLVKVYGQLNWGPFDKSFGGHLGLRVAL